MISLTQMFLILSIILSIHAIMKLNRAVKNLKDTERAHKAFQKWMDDEKTDS